METRTYKVYKYNELDDRQKEKVLNNYYDINIDHDWWEFTYEDAENIGLELTGFDLDRGSYCEGKFIFSALTCVERIIAEHGEKCDTHTDAEAYIKERKDIEQHAEADEYGEFDLKTCDKLDALTDEFLKSLLEDYRIMLQKEFDFLTSKIAVEETLIANEYDFTEDGKID